MRYKIPKMGCEIEIEVQVYWSEKDRMLKLAIPSTLENGRCIGQVAYGREEFVRHGEELVAQKWVGVVSTDGEHALTVINECTYGFDFKDGELRLSLLRSPAYSGHPVGADLTIVRQDRFEPRIDQGERLFHFWLNAGRATERLLKIEREAQCRNEPPLALCCFPSGTGKRTLPAIKFSDEPVVLSAMKYSEVGDVLILRLFEPTGSQRATTVSIPSLNKEFEVLLSAFEIKTIAVDIRSRQHYETDLLERKLT